MLRIFLCVLFMTTNVFAMGQIPAGTPETTLIGKQAPDFTLERINSAKSNLTDARGGKKAIIIFWATWCGVCKEELAKLNPQVADIEAQGVKILLVNVGDSKEEVRAFMRKKGYGFDSFLDEESALQEPYGLVGVPTLVFVDDNGIVKNFMHGFPRDYLSAFNGT